jgi:hypothetical protein
VEKVRKPPRGFEPPHRDPESLALSGLSYGGLMLTGMFLISYFEKPEPSTEKYSSAALGDSKEIFLK